MSYQMNSIVFFCFTAALLALAVWRYARWLDTFDGSYNPDLTGLTVIGGVAIVLSAYGLLAVMGLVSWSSFGVICLLFLIAGSLIMVWQYEQLQRRKKDREQREATYDPHAQREEAD